METYLNLLKNESALAIHEPNTLCEMAAKVCEYNFVWQYFTLLVFVASMDGKAVQIFSRNYQKGFAVSTLDKLNATSEGVPQIIVFGHNTHDIIHILARLVKLDYDIRGKYVIVCSGRRCFERPIFNALSEYSIGNVLFLKNFNQSPAVFDYVPLIPENCNNSEPRRLNHIHIGCKDDYCYKKLFHLELNNMQLCPFIAAGFDYPPAMIVDSGPTSPSGVDGETLKVLAYKLNATLCIKEPNVTANGKSLVDKWTLTMEEIYAGRADTLLYGIPYPHNLSERILLISYPLDTMYSVWIIAMPENLRAWEIVLYPLQSEVWLVIVTIYVLIVGFSYFMKTVTWRKISKTLRIESKTTKRRFIFYSFVMFLGLPIEKLSKRLSFRIIIFIWIWSSFILRCSYTSSLLIFLKMRHFDNFINTIYDAHKYGAKFGGHASLKTFLADDPVILTNYIGFDNDAIVVETDKLLNGTSDLILALDEGQFYEIFGKLKNIRVKLKKLPDTLVSRPTIYQYSKKYSLLMASIDRIIQRMIECGLKQYFKSRFLGNNYEKWLNHNNDFQKDVARPLSNSQIKGVYIVFSICIIISLCVLIIEVICAKLNKIVTV